MTDDERIEKTREVLDALDRVKVARKAAAKTEKQFNYYSAQWHTWEEMAPGEAEELREAYLVLGRLLYL